MLALFRRKTAPPSNTPAAADSKELWRPQTPAVLLGTPRRQRLLEQIWQRTSLSRVQFAALYRAPLERYAALVQHFPASESHHHAYPGGMLDHGLESVAYVLRLRQSHLLPAGAPPEAQAAQAEAWTAGAAYGALLHDIGKIAVDLEVEYADGDGWHPWHGPLKRPYRFRYRPDREYRLHGAAAGLLYTDILDASILDWLSGYPELWAALLYVLAGRYEHAGVLGELVVQADRASTAQALGGDPAKARAAPKHALQRKLLEGLRYLVKAELRLNQPQASDGWLTQDALWLVAKTVCDKLRAHLLSQGIEGIPSSNTAVFDVLQDHGIVQPAANGKAIWRATVTSGSWSHSFTFLRLAPALIWETGERPAPFSGVVHVEETTSGNMDEATAVSAAPASSSDAASAQSSIITTPTVRAESGDSVSSVLALLDETTTTPAESGAFLATSAHTAAPLLGSQPLPSDANRSVPTAQEPDSPPGMQFLAWLRHGIQMRRVIINDARALVHTVAGTAFLVSPGIFHRYTHEHPEIAQQARQDNLPDWEWVQKKFERLRLHKTHDNGLNIWTCEVTGPRRHRRVHGYLLVDGRTLFADLPFDNPYLKVVDR